jgi:hypothetical protein
MTSYADRIGKEYREKGREEGRAEGHAEALLRQLGVRFGEVPPTTEDRVRKAPVDQLDLWLERVLSATSLEEVFAAE